jgi:DNA-binding response OmpR family regulator
MKTRLLWADADSKLTEVTAEYFRRFDFDVRTTCSPLQCVLELRDFRPDVAVLDLDLVWRNVRELLEGLCEDGEIELPRVVLVTGDECEEVLAAQTGQPVEHCLTKPFRLVTVLDRICARLDESRAPDEDVACCDV